MKQNFENLPSTTAEWQCRNRNSPFGGFVSRPLASVMRGLFISIFLLCSFSLWGQDSISIMPNKMISLNVGTNIFTSKQSYQTDVGYHTAIMFGKRVLSTDNVNLYTQMGLCYKYLKASNSYVIDDEDHSIYGTIMENYEEQDISPLIKLSLYTKLIKKIYIESSLGLDYNFFLNGYQKADFSGTKYVGTGKLNYLIQEPYHYQYNYSLTNRMILGSIDGFYAFEIGYSYRKINVGLQFKFPFPDYINQIRHSLSFNIAGKYSHQNIFSLQINYFFK